MSFYRAMHRPSAKRGIAIACRLSVRLSVTVSPSGRLWRWWIRTFQLEVLETIVTRTFSPLSNTLIRPS